ncbi:MFS transporter [Mycolicibacterium sphagni]|uniref:MFS transporter n=1 Tax=Mycolicibacterium sphagni TaxID=1786 RepID=A0A255DRW8_9MYCO|nr:MFS transporter [Mycolicibacterium sphagni]OYN82207.1 MFS transporter [Mycolicibacterium sphagni]
MKECVTRPTTGAPPEPAAAQVTGRQRNLVFLAVVLGMLLAALDQTIVATALPTVVADLGGAGHQSWVVTSYLLASTIVTAVVGKLGDTFGRKVVFQAAVLFFLAGSVLCGLAGSMTVLVASRALQGIGGGAITVTAVAVIGEVIPLRERGRYQGALGAVFGVTTVVGPLLGGLFTDHLGWRWAFWVNVPVAVVVLIVAAWAIPKLGRSSRPVIDYSGIVLIGLGAAGLTLATSWGGTTYPWGSATIIGLFVGSIAALVAFVVVESRATEPILPIRLFKDPVFTVCCVLSFVVGFAMLGALTFLPTYMQFVDGVSATVSGLHTLPMVVGLLATSLTSGVIVGRTGRYKIFPVVGTAVMAAGFVLLSFMDAHTSVLVQSLDLLILGAGIGLSMQVLVLTVQNTVDFTDLGVATSGVTFFRTIGSSFGAAIFGSLFSNFLADRLPAALAASGTSAAVAQSPQALHKLSHEVAAPIVNAYADSLSRVFLFAAPVAVVGFVLALFLKQVPLRDAAAMGSTDLGEGFGMPTTEPAEKVLEVAVSRLLRESRGMHLPAVAQSAGIHLDTARMWALLQVYRHAQMAGAADLAAIAARHRVPVEILEPAFARLVAAGYAQRAGDYFSLTASGATEVNYARNLIASWITDTLTRSPAFEGRPDRLQVQGAMERIARNVLAQEDGTDTTATRPLVMGAGRPAPDAAATTRLPIGPALSAGIGNEPTRPFRPRAEIRRPPPPGQPRR